jgi:hypothetical protein
MTFFFLVACDDSRKPENLKFPDDYQKVEASNYSIFVPNYMESAVDLNESASVQYKNELKELYMIIIEEYRVDLIDYNPEYDDLDPAKSYLELQANSISSNLNSVKMISEPKAFNMSGKKAYQLRLDGDVTDDKIAVSYLLTVIHDDKKVYFNMSWTLDKYIRKYSETLGQMSRSFSFSQE